METKLTIQEFKHLRYKIALALNTVPRFILIDTVEKDENGYTKVKAFLKGYYPYNIQMHGDEVIRISREVG